MKNLLKLCLVTNQARQTTSQYLDFVKEAVRGGVTMVQLREKAKTTIEVKEMALELKKILSILKIPLIINDNVALAVEIDADGVHIGQSDMKAKEARMLLGPNKIIGISIENIEDLHFANTQVGNYYVAASAVFASQTKLDCKTIWGLDGLEYIVKNSIHPVVAIGNINHTNIKDVMMQGVSGVAVISAIHNFKPYEAALKLSNYIEEKYVTEN